MKLTLKTIFKGDYTIGRLYVDGVYFCDTLEDKVREINNDGDLLDPGEQKIFGETAIPAGSYEVIINHSSRFQKQMPLLLNVKHFEGIRMHNGATKEHTHGCILVGKNTAKGKLTKSKATFDELMKLLDAAIFKRNEKVTIEITR